MKKIIKKIIVIISVVFVLLCGLVFGLNMNHNEKTTKEAMQLEEYGYEKYSAGDYNLGIYRIGNKDSKYKLIALSGMGVNDYSIGMSAVNRLLKEDYEIIYIDRAGYGYSDDTDVTQTTEQIVNDYRTALKNAGIEGSYILLPHSLGGMYSTYWANSYPNEIEGIVFIDCSIVEEDARDWEEYKTTFLDKVTYALCQIGAQRLVLREFSYPVPKYCTEEHQQIADYLNIYSATTKAKLSESDQIVNNFNFTYEHIKSDSVPKVFVNATSGYRTEEEVFNGIEWLRNRQKEVGIESSSTEITSEIAQKVINDATKHTNDVIVPYLEKMGNTKLVNLGGNHALYEERPEELAEVIREFVENIDNDKGDF